MVRRFALYWIMLAALLIGLLLGWRWLFYTDAGARWALGELARFAPVTVGQVEGRLAGPLHVRDLRMNGAFAVRAERVALRWRPAALLHGALRIDRLRVSGVTIADNRPPTPPTPPTFRVPALPGWLARRDIRVDALQVDDLAYRKGGKPVYALYHAGGALHLQNGFLSLRALRLQDRFGSLMGMLNVGLDNTLLQGQGLWTPARATAVQAVYWTADWRAAGPGQDLAGPVYVLLRAQNATLGSLDGRLLLAAHALRFHDFRFDWKGLPDPVHFAGRLAFPNGTPYATLAASADWNLGRLSPQLKDTGLIWRASIRGGLNGYRGRLSVAGKGAGWRQGSVSGRLAGDLHSLGVTDLRGKVLGGAVRGAVTAGWTHAMRVSLGLRFARLNPALVTASWPGSLNGSVALAGGGKGFFDRGAVLLALDKSQVHRQPVQGALAADWVGKDLHVAHGHVYGRGVDLFAHGDIARRLDLRLAVADFGQFLPQARGGARAQGWLRYRGGVLAAELSGQGSRLAYGTYRVAGVRLQGSMAHGPAGPLQASFLLRGLSNGDYRVQSLAARFAGTLKQQRWQANAAWSGGHLRLLAEGRQLGASLAGPWQWRLSDFTAAEQRAGRWRLTRPATVYLDANAVRVSPVLLRDTDQGRVELSADLKRNPWTGRFNAAWQGLPVLPGYFPKSLGMSVRGRLAGTVQGRLLTGRQFTVHGNAALSAGELRWRRPKGELVAQIRTAQAQFAWAGQQLQGTARLVLSGYGKADAAFTLPLPAQYPVAFNAAGPVQGRAAFQVKEKGLLLVALPGIVQEGEGNLQGVVTAGGTWAQPQLGGDVQLSGAAAFVPKAGIYVSGIGARVVLAGDTVQVTNIQAHSGNGSLGGQGTITLRQFKPVAYAFTLTGMNFRALDLPGIQADASPNLQIRQAPGGPILVRGEVRVPYVLLTGINPGGIKPSGDVVFVDEHKPKGPPATQNVDLSVNLVLGKDVWVKTQGASVQLGGSLRMSMRGAQPPQAHGTIKVLQGVYEGYHQKLKIMHGEITFAGPINQPNLNLYAARKVKHVTAGILITGIWPEPRTVLSSTPSMPPGDILSYIVLGHPMAPGGSQNSLLAQAAGSLLNLGEAAKLRKSLQGGLGLDTLQITPTGSGTSGLSDAMVTIGKRLNARLYVSIGRSIFTNDLVVRARYQLSRFWELQAESGTQSGLDAFYRIEMR